MTSQDQLPHITTVKDRAKSKLERDAREILSALQDPETVEIMVNADGRIWQRSWEKRYNISEISRLPRLKPSSKRLQVSTARRSIDSTR